MTRSLGPVLLMLLCVFSILSTRSSALAQDSDFVKSTTAYKTVGKLDILADIYRPPGEKPVPVVVWIHGGALINGHREGISNRVRNYAKDRGFALVSIDYRLAPETKLPLILEDVQDAFRWIHGDAARRFRHRQDGVAGDTGEVVRCGCHCLCGLR